MKRLSTTNPKRNRARKNGYKYNEEEKEVAIDWEVRPGGLLVQKRGGVRSASPMIKIKVSHDSCHLDISLPAQSTFGDLKRRLVHETGLEPKEQRLLFRGKEQDDLEYLHMAGVKDTSKVILLEDPASKERKIEEKNKGNLKAFEAIANVRGEVDKLLDKVVSLERAVQNGIKVAENEFVVLTELLMMQLLILDGIEADGEARAQRRTEVHRVQSFVDVVDNMKARTCKLYGIEKNGVSVTTKWEIFDSGVGSLCAPTTLQAATKVTQDWEMFD